MIIACYNNKYTFFVFFEELGLKAVVEIERGTRGSCRHHHDGVISSSANLTPATTYLLSESDHCLDDLNAEIIAHQPENGS